MQTPVEYHDTLVIGGGQAGLTTGYYLKQHGRDFVILDAHARIGDAWRTRWDSLRLFSPARYNGLAGMPFPAPARAFPTKDEMAGYLEAYAARFELPVRTGARVNRLWKEGNRFVATAGGRRYEASNVVVAMGSFQQPRLPAFAADLAPDLVQMHSSAYRGPGQLRPGGVLIVGAGNSGAEIALDVAATHPTWLSGRDTGQIPVRIDSLVAHLLVIPVLFRLVFHRVLTIRTPMGRKAKAEASSHGMARVRVKAADLAAAGVQRVPRTVGVRNGHPVLEDGRVPDVANVIWCTGYRPGLDWIDLPSLGEAGPVHERGVVVSEPGLYFVGQFFQYAVSSAQVQGVARDAAYVVQALAARQPQPQPSPGAPRPPQRQPAAQRAEERGRP